MSEAKTTIYLDATDYRRLRALARTMGKPAAALIREAVAEYTSRHAAPARPSSIGAGRSRTGTVAERAEDLLEGLGEKRPK